MFLLELDTARTRAGTASALRVVRAHSYLQSLDCGSLWRDVMPDRNDGNAKIIDTF